jgi:hypothetical protein
LLAERLFIFERYFTSKSFADIREALSNAHLNKEQSHKADNTGSGNSSGRRKCSSNDVTAKNAAMPMSSRTKAVTMGCYKVKE